MGSNSSSCISTYQNKDCQVEHWGIATGSTEGETIGSDAETNADAESDAETGGFASAKVREASASGAKAGFPGIA